jgi:hypothetical protein
MANDEPAERTGQQVRCTTPLSQEDVTVLIRAVEFVGGSMADAKNRRALERIEDKLRAIQAKRAATT